MKKVTFAISVLSGLILLGCSSGGGGGGGGGGYAPPPPPPPPPTSSPSVVVEVDSSDTSKNLSSVAGKKIFLAKVNTGAAVVDSSRYVESTSPEISGTSADMAFDMSSFVPEQEEDTRHCGYLEYNSKNLEPITSSRSGDISYDITPTDYNVGDTKNIIAEFITERKNITANGQSWTPSSATKALSAICGGKGAYCYVWVVEDLTALGPGLVQAEKDSGLNPEFSLDDMKNFAAEIATKFDAMYPIIRNVFGNETDDLKSGSTYIPMESSSETGKKVNIVILDIPSKNTAGYFHTKDFYTAGVANSNAGKYFYIDSEWLKKDFTETLNTIAHEFQHMINHSVKNIRLNETPDTSYNEMLSMLCEDMMLSHFGKKFVQKGSVLLTNRLLGFKKNYYLSGTREWLASGDVLNSYSTSYMFGAWLCRQYGGAKLVKEMMGNNSVNEDSIVAAVNALKGTSYTFTDLMVQYLRALLNDSTYTFNKAAAQTVTDSSGYAYPMEAINLYVQNYQIEVNQYYPTTYPTGVLNNTLGLYGPALFSAESVFPGQIRPNYGITLQYVGTVPSGTSDVTVYFSGDAEEHTKTYLIAE